jgi:hypothetical protein
MRRFRVTTAAIQTQKFCMSLWTIQKYWNYCHQSETTRSLRTVEPYVAVKNIKMLCCYGNVKFYCRRATKNVVLLSTMQTYLGIHVNRLRFLSDFNQIWFFSTALHIRLQRWLQIRFQWEASCYMRASDRHAEGNICFYANWANEPKSPLGGIPFLTHVQTKELQQGLVRDVNEPKTNTLFAEIICKHQSEYSKE